MKNPVIYSVADIIRDAKLSLSFEILPSTHGVSVTNFVMGYTFIIYFLYVE